MNFIDMDANKELIWNAQKKLVFCLQLINDNDLSIITRSDSFDNKIIKTLSNRLCCDDSDWVSLEHSEIEFFYYFMINFFALI